MSINTAYTKLKNNTERLDEFGKASDEHKLIIYLFEEVVDLKASLSKLKYKDDE